MKSKNVKCLVSIAFAVGISLKLNNGIAVANPNTGNEATSLKAVSGVVTADALNVRSAGNTSSSVLGTLYKGDNITIVESVNGWHKINFNNKVGWVYGEFIETKKSIESNSNKVGTINADSLNIRSGAGTSYSILGSLKGGAKIDIINSTNGWFQINCNGTTGYVSGEYVTLSTGNSDSSRPSRGGSESNSSVNKSGTVKVSALNFRTGPGTNYDVIQSLKQGTKLEITEEVNGWYKCVYNSNTGYVSKEFVSLSDSSTTVPTPAPAPETPTTVPTINGKVALISVEALNIRSGAGTNYSKVEVARYGDRFPIIAHSNGWYKISIGGKEGWIYGEYIKIINSTDVVPPVVNETSPTQSKYTGEDIVAKAEKYLGTPYLWGGFTPLGFDCSGLVQYVYRQFGIELERTSYYQVHQGVAVSRDELKPGDLLFFTTDDSRPDSVSHVGIYKGNDLFIQAPKPGDVVRISNLNSAYYSTRYYTAKRILK